MKRATCVVASFLLATVFSASAVQAGLPGAEPPKDDSPPPKTPPSDAPPDPGQGKFQIVIPLGKPQREPPPREAPPSFEQLMRSVADSQAPLAADVREQLVALRPFADLSPADQDRAMPELLTLLEVTAALPAAKDSPVLQVRHRANVALAQVARVYFGQFPARPAETALTDEEKAADQKASKDLVRHWQDWWKEAKGLDAAGRVAAAKRLRTPLYDSTDDRVFWTNVRFAVDQQDTGPMPQLTRRLKKRGEHSAEATRAAIDAYGLLCEGSRDVPPETGLALVEFLKEVNTPETANDPDRQWWLRAAAIHLRRITGITGAYLEARETQIGQGETRQTVTVHMVSEEAIKAWESAIRARMPAATKPAAEAPAGK